MASAQGQPLATPAWFTRTRVDQFPVIGMLSLADGRISFSVTEKPSRGTAKFFEEVSGQPGLADRFADDVVVEVLNIPVEEVTQVKYRGRISPPGVMFSAAGETWRFWFDHPNAGIFTAMSGWPGGPARDAWKAQLPPS